MATVVGLTEAFLDGTFFASVVANRGILKSWSKFALNSADNSGLWTANVTVEKKERMVGHFGYQLLYKDQKGDEHTLSVVLKSRATDKEACQTMERILEVLGLQCEKHTLTTGAEYCTTREIELCSELDIPELKAFMPDIHNVVNQPDKDVYVIVMEYLSAEGCSLLNTADDTTVWTMSDIKVVLRDLAKIHSVFLTKSSWLEERPWLERMTGETMSRMEPLWRAYLKTAGYMYPDFWTNERVSMMESAIDNIPQIWSVLDTAPTTLIHNDCNPRNICLRRNTSVPSGPSPPGNTHSLPFADQQSLCMYDWEVATIGVPQRDVVEFLAFTLQPSASQEMWNELIEFYRLHLQYYSHQDFPADRFKEVFKLSGLDFAMNRLQLYTIGFTYRTENCAFVPRVVNSLFSYLESAGARDTDWKRLVQ